MKNSKEKIPDRLVDSCKCSSVNRMAAGSSCLGLVMEFFSFLLTFHIFFLTYFATISALSTGSISCTILKSLMFLIIYRLGLI